MTNTNVSDFVFDPVSGNVVLAFNGSGALTDRYLYGPAVDELLADERVSSLSSAGTNLWTAIDNEGSVRDVWEDGVGLIDHIVYNSFGAITSQTNSYDAPLIGYTGSFTDPDTGLQWHNDPTGKQIGRWYDPKTQQWIGQDPDGLAPDSNPYRYVGNSPTNATDPSGLAPDPDAVEKQRQAAAAVQTKQQNGTPLTPADRDALKQWEDLQVYLRDQGYNEHGEKRARFGKIDQSPPASGIDSDNLGVPGYMLFAQPLPVSQQWNAMTIAAWENGARIPGHNPFVDANAMLLNFTINAASMASVQRSLAPGGVIPRPDYGSVVAKVATTAADASVAKRVVNNFATDAGEAFFWSGKTAGIGGADVAANFAKSQGGTTLEQLAKAPGSICLSGMQPTRCLPRLGKTPLVRSPKAHKGTVKAVIGDTLRPGNVWETYEFPALKLNTAVTKVIRVEPGDGAETVIFTR